MARRDCNDDHPFERGPLECVEAGQERGEIDEAEELAVDRCSRRVGRAQDQGRVAQREIVEAPFDRRGLDGQRARDERRVRLASLQRSVDEQAIDRARIQDARRVDKVNMPDDASPGRP
jgi:hypothetical protein